MRMWWEHELLAHYLMTFICHDLLFYYVLPGIAYYVFTRTYFAVEYSMMWIGMLLFILQSLTILRCNVCAVKVSFTICSATHEVPPCWVVFCTGVCHMKWGIIAMIFKDINDCNMNTANNRMMNRTTADWQTSLKLHTVCTYGKVGWITIYEMQCKQNTLKNLLSIQNTYYHKMTVIT